MKVTVESEFKFTEMFTDDKVELLNFIQTVKEFGRQAVWLSTANVNDTSVPLNKLARTKLDYWLASKFRSHALIQNPQQRPFDFNLDVSMEQVNPVAELINNPNFENRVAQYRAPISFGAKREDIFKSRLGRLAQSTKSFHYVDAFFLEHLLKQEERSGAKYLIRKLLESGVENIEIKTVAVFPAKGTMTSAAVSRAATKLDFSRHFNLGPVEDFLKFLVKNFNPKATIRIKIYRKAAMEVPHDRYGMLVLNSGDPVYFMIGPGINVFANPTLKEDKASFLSLDFDQAVDLTEVTNNHHLFHTIEIGT